jgi:simple sugar transport system permease protein
MRKFEVMIWSGILGGLAGAYLSLGYSKMFVENMTNGRGFMGVAAMYFGGANPIWGWVGCLIFGFADSLASRLQSLGLPPQFILAIPFVVTVAVLALAMRRANRRELRRKSAV